MATGTTTTLDLIEPDVWADALAPRIFGASVFAGLAEQDDTLVGQPGATVTTPRWNYIGDAEDLTEGVAMDLTRMGMTDSQATIKEVGKGVEATDSATLTALGSPNSEAERQIAISVARKVDTDLRAAAIATTTENGQTSAPLRLAPADVPLSWNRLVKGLALLGDEYDVENVGALVVHSDQHAQLLVDPRFISSESFGAGATIQRGQIGSIGRIPVLVSNRGVGIADLDGGKAGNQAGWDALVIMRGALRLLHKRRPIVETDRDIRRRVNIVTTNAHYAVKRVDDRGVIAIPTNLVVPD